MIKSKTIFIVEDEEDLREIYSCFFEDEGYNVLSFNNGKTALDCLLSLGPDSYPSCIILDLMMPVMSGTLFLAEIHKNHSTTLGKIPVVICSGYGDYINTKQVISKFTKPIDLMSLSSTIERVVSPIQISASV